MGRSACLRCRPLNATPLRQLHGAGVRVPVYTEVLDVQRPERQRQVVRVSAARHPSPAHSPLQPPGLGGLWPAAARALRVLVRAVA